ncbi:hypothetical protein AB7M18_000916 [Pseudomonas viridiflava]|uniref:hypothetical protein n=1 Tax=Pseudomonas syringae TaxID=317 RepID=UPI000BB609A2|nr:hypothetical protein [Pseudomonas syringae]PBP84086.1 hypothetical protein CCL22_08795 [Pseudomonas syringae]
MNPLKILTASFGLLFRNAPSIALLCVPLLVVEMFIRDISRSQLGIDNDWAWQAIIGTVIPPLYTAMLLLILDARGRDESLAKIGLLSKVIRLWPALAVLSALDQMLIIIHGLAFISADTWLKIILSTVQVIPPGGWVAFKWAVFLLARWVMMRLMFNQCLVLFRGLSIKASIRESIILSRGLIWQVVACLALLLAPLWLATVIVSILQPDWVADVMIAVQQNSPGSVTAYSIFAGFIRLFTTIVVFRFFTAVAERQGTKE